MSRMSPELAGEQALRISYIAGLVGADGHLAKGEKSISVYSKNTAFASSVARMLREISGGNARIYKSKGALKVYLYSPELYSILVERYSLPPGKKSDKISFPRNLSKTEQKFFLQGYADGDGSVYTETRKRPSGKHDHYLRVEIASKSLRFLHSARAWLKKQCAVNSGKVSQGKRVFRLRIYARNAERFVDIIGFRHPEKSSVLPKPQGVELSP